MPPRPLRRVAIRPLWDAGLKGRLFDVVYPWTLNAWRTAAAAKGYLLDGWDQFPLAEADCVWLLDLPDRKRTFVDARRQARPGTPFVLQVMETPVGRAHNFEPANQALCDVLVTYQQGPIPHPCTFRYRLPHSLAYHGPAGPAFRDRAVAIMVNSNRIEGYFAPRQTGLVGLPGVGRNFSGWKMPAWTWLNPARGELYSWRRQLARTADELDPNLLHVIGPNWRGERVSWNPLFPRKPFRCCISPGTDRKLELTSRYRFCISVENFQGRHDYISEKILDPMVVGSVPVYLGEERITDTVPAAAFVDVRNFRNQAELLRYLRDCPETEWQAMQAAGHAFLQTPAARAFSTDTFVEQMNAILDQIIPAAGSGASTAATT